MQQTNYFSITFFFSFLKVHIKIINLLSYFLSIIKNVIFFFFFFLMRNAISMNFCIPTFDFCAAGFPTRCQFDRLTEGFWPKNHKLLWPLTGREVTVYQR